MSLIRKNLWTLSGNLKVVENDVVVDEETGKAVFATAKSGTYSGITLTEKDLEGMTFYDTKEQVEEAQKVEVEIVKAAMPKVRKFLERMKYMNEDGPVLKFKREEYLGSYAEDRSSGYYEEWQQEQDYAGRLETFIRSRMLNIDSQMVPVADVKNIQWYLKEGGDEYEDSDIQAELTMKDGTQLKTQSAQDARLCIFIFGRNQGQYFIGDFDYDKEE